jgi:hypothetical protein
MTAASGVAVAVTFVWCGMVLAISFIETPLKFRAPEVTVRIGLGIGRLVFRALNTAEIVLALALIGAALIEHPPRNIAMTGAVAVIALIVQVSVVRPRLTRRSDLVLAGHAAPRVIEKLRGRTMVAIEGGTQALRRTINARLQIAAGRTTTVSVPSPFGAVILKAAAYQTDSRDRERHLQDAALLLAVIDAPYAEREQFAGSARSRLETLARALPDSAAPWPTLPADARANGQTAMRILNA